MAKSFAIRDEREYPEYEFREYPKHLGFDIDGLDIEVADSDEETERAADVVYPKPLGKDRNGKPVIAMGPTDEAWKIKTVVGEKTADGETKRGPGRPPKDPV